MEPFVANGEQLRKNQDHDATQNGNHLRTTLSHRKPPLHRRIAPSNQPPFQNTTSETRLQTTTVPN